MECEVSETARFDPPPGSTCTEYAGDFAQQAGGYLLNPDATSVCQYCQYTVGNQYLASLNIEAGQSWRDFGIFLVFVFTNWALVYFFIYTVRIKGWSFGFGHVFGGLGKVVGAIKKPFKGKGKKSEE